VKRNNINTLFTYSFNDVNIIMNISSLVRPLRVKKRQTMTKPHGGRTGARPPTASLSGASKHNFRGHEHCSSILCLSLFLSRRRSRNSSGPHPCCFLSSLCFVSILCCSSTSYYSIRNNHPCPATIVQTNKKIGVVRTGSLIRFNSTTTLA